MSGNLTSMPAGYAIEVCCDCQDPCYDPETDGGVMATCVLMPHSTEDYECPVCHRVIRVLVREVD